ncbi:MAG: MFS transporter [Verrucomicrobiota bacterium]
MTAGARPPSWKWWVCGLLLLASTINYMDRQTLANAATRISHEFGFKQEQYGNLEFGFGLAFAVGSLLFGFAVDRIRVRWLYPTVLLLWSGVGFATGFVESYGGLLVCRTLLGLFEGGHWPCAIKTTQQLLAPQDRALGNGVLQSGTSIGAILMPLVMRLMLTDAPGSWRFPFQLVGAVGMLWIVLWFALVSRRDFPAPVSTTGRGTMSGRDLLALVLSRRMLVLFALAAAINTCWQTLRAWLPKFLMEGRGYAESGALYFNAGFYVATDIGCLGAGALALWMARRGTSVHSARVRVFLGCALLCALTSTVGLFPRGGALLVLLLLAGAGALGVFPIYHAVSQEISAEHQGKVTGIASVAAWALPALAQKFFGRLVDRTGSFDLGFAIAGLLPLASFFVLWLFWNPPDRKREATP